MQMVKVLMVKRTPYPTPPPQYAAVAYLMDQQNLVLHSMLYQSSLSKFCLSFSQKLSIFLTCVRQV